ncbi:AbrB/MazE/SpoVT family DNA-binding domain-containing protein [Ruminococcaceae bacterium OttesenSCG-928-N02]|nr:AbrB/MazE/SpoVT family DNA-binding domain-containing protein [Ruminococcaceae bacterium OttesenSCG-928-N02]
MKATGIVRRIDDLGRVVIPKEIRRTLHIREGEPLEIFTTGDGEVVFKKYSPIGEMAASARQVVDVVQRSGGLTCAVCDRDHIIAIAGLPKKDFVERRITHALEKAIEARRTYVQGQSGAELIAIEGHTGYASIVVPILAGGDISGAVFALTTEASERPSELDVKLVTVAAGFLGKQVEE